MHLEADTAEVVGVADDVRRAAAQVGMVALPRRPTCDDMSATDAIGALFVVFQEDLSACTQALHLVGELIEVAGADYAKVEAQAAVRP